MSVLVLFDATPAGQTWLTTLTLTSTSTMEITYNEFATVNGTAIIRGHVLTTTTLVVYTVVAESTFPPPYVFKTGLLAVGLVVLGVFILFMRRYWTLQRKVTDA